MWTRIKTIVRAITPKKVKEFFAYEFGDEFSAKIYSQEGEDILLSRIFDDKPSGFYVDIGAHHPFRFSNTKLLYDRGWRGINIEPNPDIRHLFDKHRPKDINLSIGVDETPGTLNYYRFNHPALNSFDASQATRVSQAPKSTDVLPVESLKNILDKHMPINRKIDLLLIDAEGLDLRILKSNDWTKYFPSWILVELQEEQSFEQSDIHVFLEKTGYKMVSKLWKSCLFKKQ